MLWIGSPSYCWPFFWLDPFLVNQGRGIVFNLLGSSFFEKTDLLLEVLYHLCHSDHRVWLSHLAPLPWGDFVFYQGYLIPLPRIHFIFSHGFWCRGWQVSTLAVPWPWSRALRRDYFFLLLCPVPSVVALKWGFLFWTIHRPKWNQGSWVPKEFYNCCLMDWAWFTAAILGWLRTKLCTKHGFYNTYISIHTNICVL